MDVDVDLIGWLGVMLGGTHGCRCGIFFVGVVFYTGLVSLARRMTMRSQHHHAV